MQCNVAGEGGQERNGAGEMQGKQMQLIFQFPSDLTAHLKYH